MKKIFFTSTLSILTSLSFTQNKIEYANFIQSDTSIKWAAICNYYINLTPVNPNFNLSNYFFENLKKGIIETYKENTNNFSVIPSTTTYNSLKENLVFEKYNPQKANWVFYYDERHDATEEIFNADSNECDSCLNKRISLFKLKQLLYYKDHQLKIKNILINPIVYKKKIDEHKEDAMYAETMNILFDSSATENNVIPKSAIFINRTCNRITLLPTGIVENKILTINNWSLTRILYNELRQKKNKSLLNRNKPIP